MLGGLVLAIALSWQSSYARIVFVRVGQGDCTLIQDGGTTVLIDAAGADEFVDLGQRLAVPELRRLGVTRLDMVLLTHPDADHIGGLAAVAGRWSIGCIGIPARFRGHPAIEALQKSLPGCRWMWIESGETTKFGSTKMSFDYMPSGRDNAGSLACLVEMPGSRAVLTGDGISDTEVWLASRHEWSAELMKVGHHGSSTSTSPTWLAEVKPAFAVISCGRGNPYGHPTASVMDRLAAAGAKVFRTDRDGTVIFAPTAHGFQPVNR
jgi:competence protein ComEC